MNSINASQKKTNTYGTLFLIIVLIYCLFSAVIIFLGTKDIALPSSLTIIVTELIILVPAIIYVVKNGLSLKEALGFNKIKIKTIILSVVLGVLVIPVASFINILTQFFVPNTMTQAADSLIASGTGMLLLLSSVYGPICEEITFRGLFANGYKGVTTPIKAALISSLFFGLIHMNVNQTAYAFVLGLLFVIVNTASGSIFSSIIMHITVNGINVIMLIVSSAALSATGQSIADSSENMRNSGSLLIIAIVYFVFAVICLLIMIPILKSVSKTEGKQEELKQLFKKTKNYGDTKDSIDDSIKSKVLFNVPTIISVVIVVIYILGYDKILSALGL